MSPVLLWLIVFSSVLTALFAADGLRALTTRRLHGQQRREHKIAAGADLTACARLLGSQKQKDETEEMFVNRLRMELFRDFDFHPNHARRLLVALEGGIITKSEFRMLCPSHLSAEKLRG